MSANPRIKVEEADSTLFVPVEQSEKQYQYLLFLYLCYESSTLILYKELSSPIFQSLASVTPDQVSTLCNI